MAKANFGKLEDRLFFEKGIEIWKWNGDFLVLMKENGRYGAFYPIYKNSYDDLFNKDPILIREFSNFNS